MAHKMISGLTGNNGNGHKGHNFLRDGHRKKRRALSRHSEYIVEMRKKITQVDTLYPPDCYGPNPNGIMPNSFYLQDEDPNDIVAKLENAELAGLEVPLEFTFQDLLVAFIPSRRAIAFAYAVLQPNIGSNFSRACKAAIVPDSWYQTVLPRYPLIMQFASNFWRERINAMSGLTFIYANAHSHLGSAPHLKLLAELNGLAKSAPEHQTNTQVNIRMPDAPQTYRKALPGQTIDADAELFEDPA